MSGETGATTETNGSWAVYLPLGEGRRLWTVGDTYTLKATTESTAEGTLFVMEASVPPGGGPPPHIHHGTDEAFYVLEGEIEFLDGDRTFVAGAGSFVLIPKGRVHRFENVGTEKAKALIMATPAGFEHYFEEVGQPAGEGDAPPISPEEVEKAIAAAPKYDSEILPPPQV